MEIDTDEAEREREVRLLLACGRVHLDAQSRGQLEEILTGPIAWESVIQRSVCHGLLPLVHKHLSAVPLPCMPPDALSHMSELAVAIGRNNLRLTAEMFRIIQAFDAEGVTVVPLKGPVLAQSLYGSIALRSFKDLDFLVSPRDLHHAKEALVHLGYTPEASYWDQRRDVLLKSSYHYGFASQELGTVVEIHQRLNLPCLQTAEQVGKILDRCEPLFLLGRPVYGLSSEDQFLFLCAHGVRHLWERLEWVCGIAELVRTDAIRDWASLLSRASADGTERIVYVSLLLAEALTGTALPAVLAGRASQDHTAKRLASQAARRLLQGRDAIPEAGEYFLYTLQAFNRVGDRAGYLLFHLLTPKLADVAVRPLPRPLRLLYGIMRPLRVIPRYSFSLLRAWLSVVSEFQECAPPRQ